jgi:hypothetical protein
MKNEYNIKDQVWIHTGERNLVEGRVVEIIDLVHLKEGHSADRELYIIELKTGIEDVYEVRSFEQISPDARGPINLFRKQTDAVENNRLLKKIGMPIPLVGTTLEEALALDDDDDISPDQIHAALDRRLKEAEHLPLSTTEKPKKRNFYKRPPKKAKHDA